MNSPIEPLTKSVAEAISLTSNGFLKDNLMNVQVRVSANTAKTFSLLFIVPIIVAISLMAPAPTSCLPVAQTQEEPTTGPQDSGNDKPEWKVKRTGPKSMRNSGKTPDQLDSERIIEDQIPIGLPLTIEIRNLKTDSLLREIEVKVTNASNKPVYYVSVDIVLPYNLSEAGYPLGFPLIYGRPELIKFDSPLEPNDQPLSAGESAILKIEEKYLLAFDNRKAKPATAQEEVKLAYLMFRGLNFGDGTGFSGDGFPVP